MVKGMRKVSGFMDWYLLLKCHTTTGVYSQLSSGAPGSLWNILASSLATAAAFNSEICQAEGCLHGSGPGDADGVLQYLSCEVTGAYKSSGTEGGLPSPSLSFPL